MRRNFDLQAKIGFHTAPGRRKTPRVFGAAFRKGLNEIGYVEAQNVMVEYHWLEGQHDRLPAQAQQKQQKRTYDVLQNTDIFTRYEHAFFPLYLRIRHLEQQLTLLVRKQTLEEAAEEREP